MWTTEYNCELPHESLNTMVPEEYRQHHYLAGFSKKCLELKGFYLQYAYIGFAPFAKAKVNNCLITLSPA